MKNYITLIAVLLLALTTDSFAQLLCPNPTDLIKAKLNYINISQDESNPNPQIVALGSLEAHDKVWSIVTGFFDEKRPRLQAKLLLQNAATAEIEIDEEEGTEICTYLNTEVEGIRKFIYVRPEPKLKPCPSLQTMKETPYIGTTEICDKNQPGCGDFATFAEFTDRETEWTLISATFNDENLAINEAELLKKKAYDPVIDMDSTQNTCTYYSGIEKKKLKLIMAFKKEPLNEISKR